MKPSTIKDVAAHASVSIKTVSYVLNGGVNVSPRTRQIVMGAVEALNYHPNRAARAMRLQQSFSIALVLYGASDVPAFGNLSDPAIAVIVAAISTTAEAKGYSLSLSNFATADLSAYRRGRAQGRFDGGIFIPDASNAQALTPFFDSPLVVIDQTGLPDSVPTIRTDYRSGVRDAVTHLHARGRRRVAFLGGPRTLDVFHNTERYAGYAEGVALTGLPTAPELMVEADFTFEGARAAYAQLMAAHPDAVVAASDRMAIAVHREARARGLRLPDDLALVGFDDLESARYVDPALTTVHHPLFEVGQRAAEMLLARIEGQLPPDKAHLILPTHLVVRDSS